MSIQGSFYIFLPYKQLFSIHFLSYLKCVNCIGKGYNCIWLFLRPNSLFPSSFSLSFISLFLLSSLFSLPSFILLSFPSFLSSFLIHFHGHYINQIRSVAQSCPTLCDPMNRCTPGLPVHHQLPEFTETDIHQVSDAIQPSHPLSPPSPLAPNPSQHQ